MANTLSILHFFPRIRTEEGGVVKAVLDLTLALSENGHRVVLATCDATDVPNEWRMTHKQWPELVELNSAHWFNALLSRDSLSILEKLLPGIDVAHLHTPWEIANLQLGSLLLKNNIPYIVSIHGMLDDYCMKQKNLKKQLFLSLAGRRFFQNASTVHFTAEGEKDQASKWIPGNYQIAVQPLAMDLTPYHHLVGPEEAYSTFTQIGSAAYKVLFLSRVQAKKGLEVLLEAVQILTKQQFDIELLVAGPGEDFYVNRLKELSDKLGIGERTHFLGMVRGSLKLSLYQWADVFVLPTYQENFGLVLPEALACGTPVVTTRGTDIWPELMQAGAKIVLSSPQEIADAVASLLNNADHRNELGQQGREYVLKWLEPDHVIAGYEQMYRVALGTHSQNSAPMI